jgi:hypothetical protein
MAARSWPTSQTKLNDTMHPNCKYALCPRLAHVSGSAASRPGAARSVRPQRAGGGARGPPAAGRPRNFVSAAQFVSRSPFLFYALLGTAVPDGLFALGTRECTPGTFVSDNWSPS